MELDKNCVIKILAQIEFKLLDRYYTNDPYSLHFESTNNNPYKIINFQISKEHKDHVIYNPPVKKSLKSYCDVIKVDFIDIHQKLELCNNIK